MSKIEAIVDFPADFAEWKSLPIVKDWSLTFLSWEPRPFPASAGPERRSLSCC